MEKREIKLNPDNSLISKRIHANFAKILKGQFDISIQFCDIPPTDDIDTLEKNDFIYDVPIVAEIAIPLNMLQGLIDALKGHINDKNNNNNG